MGKLSRAWRPFAVALVACLLPLAPANPFVLEAAAAAIDRECSDEMSDLAPSRAGLCINGSADVAVRGYVTQECLLDADRKDHPPGAARFARSVCSGGKNVMGERIAQARFIQWLDERDRKRVAPANPSELPGVEKVHPGVQWEIDSGYRGLRADVLNYDPTYYYNYDPSGVPMSLWELKTSVGSPSYQAAAKSASDQALGYSETLKESRRDNLVEPTSPSRWESIAPSGNLAYVDDFVVEKRTCLDSTRTKTAIDYEFHVFDANTFPGAVIAARTVKEYNCREDQTQEEEVSDTEQAYEDNEEPEEIELRLVNPLECLLGGCLKRTVPERERVVVSVGYGMVDLVGREFWSENSPDFCQAVEDAELATGATSTASTACDGAAHFTALLEDPSFTVFLDTLDDATWRATMSKVWRFVAREGTDDVTTPARVTGDPHLVTLDGLNYDLQSVGEFTLLAIPDRDIEVQSRLVAAGATQSSMAAMATKWAGTSVEIHADGTLLVDGESITLAPGEGYTGGEYEDGYIFNDDGTFRLSWTPEIEGEEPVTLAWEPRGGAIGGFGVDVPAGIETLGLLGNNDGKPLNDLIRSDGEQVAPGDVTAIHDGFADSWRIRNEFSSFTYPAGQSTDTFTDLSFPQNIITSGDFSEAQRAQAQSVCVQSGVPAGPSFDDCELDILVTGNWDFAAAAATVNVPSVSAGDRLLDSSGRLDVDFESATLPPNLRSLRVGTDAGLGSFAGPLSGSEQYRFYVPLMPHHDAVTVEFDAYATGTWEATDTLGIQVNDTLVSSIDFTAGQQGTLVSGVPYRKVHVSVPVDHYTEQLAVTLASSGLTPASGQGFAVDNVTVQAHLVAAQTFPVTLTSDGTVTQLRQPALPAEAGVLENRGAQDRYPVTVPAGRDLFLDWQTTSTTVKWSLLDPAGAVVAGGSSSAGDARVEDLSGAYTVLVDVAGSNPPQSQPYSLDLMVAPDPQHFALTLPGPVTLPTDLPSPAAADGAGVLETKASTDVYAFAVSGQERAITINPTTCPMDGWRKRLIWAVYTQDTGALLAQGNCSTQTVTGLQAGEYELRVSPEREKPGAYAVVVSQNGPAVSFEPQPAAATNQKSVTFGFTADQPVAGYECAFDAPSYTGPFIACASGQTYPGLADGEHTMRVRAKDLEGNLGPAVAHTITVDTIAPNITITRKPPAVSNINGPVLEYSGDKAGMTYQCSLVPTGTAPQFAPCDGVSVYRDLAHGTYTFAVNGTDYVANSSTASYEFMVDLQPPTLDLQAPANLTSTTSPTFTVTADEPVTYECSLKPAADPVTFTPCTSPKAYSGLTDGVMYVFMVKATDRAGQYATYGIQWTPYSTPPTVTLTSKPAGSSSNSSPSFAFTSSIGQPTYTCSFVLSSAANVFAPCASPATYAGSAPGTYRFTVKAADASGSWVSTSYQFTITPGDTTAPTTPGTPTAALATTGTIGADTATPAGGIPVRLSWTGSTDAGGISGYEIWRSDNSAAATKVATTTGAGLTTTVTLPPGTTSYKFQVKAKDVAGNTSTASGASTLLKLTNDQQTSTKVAYAGTWSAANSVDASGGTTKYTSSATASATYKPTVGTAQVTVVMATGPAAGKASVKVDTGTAVTVDLYAPSTGQRTITLTSAVLSATSQHTIVVKPLGTKNTSSTSTRIDLDAFLARS